MDIQAGNPIDQQIATIVAGVVVAARASTSRSRRCPERLHQHPRAAQGAVVRPARRPGVIEAGYFLGYDMKCGIGFNLSAICIPKADKLLAVARKTIDKTKRQSSLEPDQRALDRGRAEDPGLR